MSFYFIETDFYICYLNLRPTYKNEKSVKKTIDFLFTFFEQETFNTCRGALLAAFLSR